MSPLPVLVVRNLHRSINVISKFINIMQVGAGPSGLVLALSLLKANVPFRIIEKSTTHHKGTRGAGMMVIMSFTLL